MRINSSRLGELEVSEGEVISFSEGFPGLPAWQAAVLRKSEAAPYLLWLQFTHDQDAAFLVLDLAAVLPDYDLSLARAAAAYGVSAQVFAIVSVPGGTLARATANLLAPVVVAFAPAPQGKQVILHDSLYPLRHALFAADEPC